MAAIVGDENTVARYLLEKAAHTALITLALHAGTLARLSLVTASLVATGAYVLVGKWWWHRQHGGAWDFRDLVFDIGY